MDLRVKLPHPGDERLVERCVEFLNAEADTASVRPLGRYGYTDSRLYLVYCAPQDGGIPFVIKTDRSEVVRREAAGVASLAVYFGGAKSADVFPSRTAPEAIIYPLVSLDGGELVCELREMVYVPAAETIPDSPPSHELLRATYQSCRSSHVCVPRRIHFGEQYKWYLRDNPERLLSDPLPNIFGRESTVEIYGHRLKDPRRVLAALSDLEIDTGVCPVHGDLHPNNVMFGPGYTPVLIDYAFGHLNGHFVKDFVLMECSLRFLLPPKLLQPDVLDRFDDALLEEFGYESVSELNSVGRGRDVLHEMASLVRVIREQCRARRREYDFLEFLIAQYFVLMGNLRLLPYQDFRTLRALCKIADRLESEIA